MLAASRPADCADRCLRSLRTSGRTLLIFGCSFALLTSVVAFADESAESASCDGAPAAAGDAAQNPRFDHAAELMASGDFAEAEAAYRAEAQAARAADDPARSLRADANALRALLATGKTKDIVLQLAALRERIGALPSSEKRAPLLINLGRTGLRAADGLSESASDLRVDAARDFAAAQAMAAEAGDRRNESFALAYLAELYEGERRFDEALQLVRRAIFAAQEADAPEALYRWQWQLGRIQRAEGQLDESLANHRAALRTLDELQGQAVAGSATTRADFRREVAPLYDGLVDLVLSQVTGAGGSAEDQARLREARDVLEDLKAAELQDYFRDSCLAAERKASPDDIPGALVVYPILLPDRLELIASESGRLSRHVSPVPASEIVSIVRAFRKTLVKRTTYQYLAHARTLYDWLIEPLRPRLDDEDVEVLVWIPGGILRTIPIAALYDRNKKQFLIEQFPVAISPSLTLTNPRPIDRERVKLLAAGISEAVQGYPALKNVPRELEKLGEVFPSEQLMNSEFSVEQFSKSMSEAPYGIVHIASHGEFAADISESYLLAYGEKLSMDRVASLVSATRFRDEPLELLTLSACKTAAGDERSALGLAGVALQAGARSALATLWSVDDAAAADLVTEFYVQLAKPELSRAQALQQAQLITMKRFRYRHAAYWAPFLLISSWL